jgi:sulfur carrier protein ThiS
MTIKVKIVQLGKGILQCELEDLTSVEASLTKVGITGAGMDLHVNGRKAQPGQQLQDGDLVTIIPRIKGGQCGGRRGERIPCKRRGCNI